MSTTNTPVVVLDEQNAVIWRGWLAGFLSDNEVLADEQDQIERHMACFEPYLIGGGAAPAFTLMRERYIVEVQRNGKWIPVYTRACPFGYASRDAAYRAIRERAQDGIECRVVTRPSNL